MPSLTLRPATADDLPLLWDCLAIAAHEDSAAEVRRLPTIMRYLTGWPRPGDFGMVAVRAGDGVGAAWARQFQPEEDPFVWVDEHTPEVAVGVREQHRNRGVGTWLLRALIAMARRRGCRGLCLSVRSGSPAVRLYERLGFTELAHAVVPNRAGGRSRSMVLRW